MWRRVWRPHATGPNFVSTSFSQPLGAHVEPGKIRGYYLDLRVKANSPSWPPSWYEGPRKTMWVALTQIGLGSHERYISGEGDQWLETAIGAADELVAEQERDGARHGSWLHRFPLPHTFPLSIPWTSALSQGQAASLLVRIAKLTSDERYEQAARAALVPMRRASADGGVVALLDGHPFFEEYPTDPPSFVLNGYMFGLWGSYDVAVGLGDASALELLQEGLDGLASNIGRFDTGYWSRYDLYPHRVTNIASLAYHELHVDQLRATALLTDREELAEAADRFAGYRNGPLNVARATARKVMFRLAVPRTFE